MNKLFAVIVLTLTVLTSAFAKDKQSDYQIGAFVLATTNADGTLTNTLHGDGTTVAGDVYANYLKTYQIKIDTGTWTVVPLNEAQDSMVRQWGMTPQHIKKEKDNPLDVLTAQPPTTQTAQTPQSSSTNTATAMSQFKKMCDSGMFTKGIYANQPLYQQQCDITFPKGTTVPAK